MSSTPINVESFLNYVERSKRVYQEYDTRFEYSLKFSKSGSYKVVKNAILFELDSENFEESVILETRDAKEAVEKYNELISKYL